MKGAKQWMKDLLKTSLAALGYRVQGTRYCPRQLLDPGCLRVIEFDDVVCRHMFETGPELTFIQIGAFDGITTDPLRKYIDKCGWRGVMVEPQAQAANKLRELYRDRQRTKTDRGQRDSAPDARATSALSFCRRHWTVNAEAAPFSQWSPKPPPLGLVAWRPSGANTSSNIPFSFPEWRQ